MFLRHPLLAFSLLPTVSSASGQMVFSPEKPSEERQRILDAARVKVAADLSYADDQPDARLLQAGLQHFRFYDGKLFGKPGPKTRAAYERYPSGAPKDVVPAPPTELLTYPRTVRDEKQSAEMNGVPMPIRGSFSCDLLARQAKEEGSFVSERSIDTSAANWFEDALGSCCIFLVRGTSRDWTHTGFAFDYRADGTFATIEGNTNDEGSCQGYEVCQRVRGRGSKDFIRLM